MLTSPQPPAGDASFEADGPYRSPLWMVTQDPIISRWVGALQRICQEQMAYPEQHHHLQISLRQVEEVRDNFAGLIRRGESKLHQLCSLLCGLYLQSWEMHSVVIGDIPNQGERFTLVQNITSDELSRLTDVDLGNRQLSRLRFWDETHGWSQPTLVANFVDYEATELDERGIHRITSRIKAEEEIWNKVVDELFQVDQLVQRDKQLRHLSRYVKDIFGLKIVVNELGKIRALHDDLQALDVSPGRLGELQVPYDVTTRRLYFVETKDYLDGSEPKRSGWRAIKSVVRWWNETFEVQIQPLRNYLKERERLTTESHASFRTRREELRAEVSRLIPLYGFYRELLRWLFLRPESPPPDFPHLTLELVD